MLINNWYPGAPTSYTEDEVAQNRVDLMWWLVNHELNVAKQTALSLLPSGNDPEPSTVGERAKTTEPTTSIVLGSRVKTVVSKTNTYKRQKRGQ